MRFTEHRLSEDDSERLRRAPPIITFAIKIANDVPKGLNDLHDIRETPKEDFVNRWGLHHARPPMLWLGALKRRVAEDGWGVIAREYVFGSPDIPETGRRYHEAIALRDLFMSIANQNEARPKGHPGDITLSLPPSPELLASLTLFVSRSNKKARLEPRGLFKAILDEGELGRIRVCAYEKCERLFWAGRVDRPCCQESCRNAYKQKRHREREKQNRANNKTRKRSKSNG